MTETPKKHPKKPPEISPYLFPFLLAAFGIWCLYDGWFTTDPEMMEYVWFNRVASMVLLPWSVYDYLKVRRYEARLKTEKATGDDLSPEKAAIDESEMG